MDLDAFRETLKREGFNDIEIAEKPPHDSRGEHAHVHHFDVAALVLRGAITLTCDGRTQTYAVGDRFDMAAGATHTEEVGPEGVQYLVGRRQ